MFDNSALRRKNSPGGFWFIWRMPALLALATALGLLAALLGRNHWLYLAWALLSTPVMVSLWFAIRRR